MKNVIRKKSAGFDDLFSSRLHSGEIGRAPKAAKPPAAVTNPSVEKRRELKKLALSRKILSDSEYKAQAQPVPSKTVLKHHSKDIIKKSQRKIRYLFSFPGLLAPISGGKIGELIDLGTKNPILYLDFPQGQMKLFGTILYPENRYLTLQFSRGGKNVMCEDNFDNMIVFSDAWWIGRKEDNPEEARLDFPKEMIQASGTCIIHLLDCNELPISPAELPLLKRKYKKNSSS